MQRFLSIRSAGRSWTVNGAIPKSTRPGHFYLDPSATNSKILLPKIHAGEYIMLYGARASGKTTRAYKLMEQLEEEYSVLDSSFQTGVDFRGYDQFWKSFGKALFLGNRRYNLPIIKSAIEFADMMKLENKDNIFNGKPVVLFIDEFDKLYSAKTEVVDSVLDVFRGIKQQRSNYCLHSLVGIGPFSILHLSSRSSSPFNVRYAVQSPFWTLEEVTALFREFAEERRLNLDFRIIEDVFTRTGGHAGLVCMCGKAMDELFLRNKSDIQMDDWIRYATFSFASAMDHYPTMMKLSETLSEENPDMKRCVEFLYRVFLPIDGSVEISRSYDDKDRRICRFLTSEGALRHEGGDFYSDLYSIPSPLVRSLLFDRVVRKLTGRPLPSIPPPLRGDFLDVEELLKTSLLSFDESFVTNTVRSSFKIFHDEKVPQEAAYQAELERILRCWLPQGISVITQHNVGGRKRCDIVITPSRDERIVLELVVSESAKVIEEHFVRAREYADVLNAKECWVLHISTDATFKCPSPDPALRVKVMNVYHDLKLSKFTLWN